MPCFIRWGSHLPQPCRCAQLGGPQRAGPPLSHREHSTAVPSTTHHQLLPLSEVLCSSLPTLQRNWAIP